MATLPTNDRKLHAEFDERKQQKHLAKWYLTCFVPTAFANILSIGISEVNVADGMQQDWRELCVAVTNETDSAKLSSLVHELIEALDKGERSWRYPTRLSDSMETNR